MTRHQAAPSAAVHLPCFVAATTAAAVVSLYAAPVGPNDGGRAGSALAHHVRCEHMRYGRFPVYLWVITFDSNVQANISQIRVCSTVQSAEVDLRFIASCRR